MDHKKHEEAGGDEIVHMKDKADAIKKEIKGRATAMLITFALADVILAVMLAALWGKQSSRIVLLVFLLAFSAIVILCVLAVCKPLSFRWMFRNLKAEQKAKPRPRRTPNSAGDSVKQFVSTVFHREISVRAENASEKYVRRCIDFFQNMKENEIDFLAEESQRYYREMVEMSGDTAERMPEEINGREILNWIYPKVMWIDSDREVDGPMAFIVECDCEWEPEHGLEIVAFDERIIHVGSYDGDLDYWKEVATER